MKRVILILIFSFLTLFGANKDILNPNSEVYDFTFESNNVPLEEFSQGSYVNKISVEVDKIIGSLPRFFKTNTCGTDTYGNNYCNEALSECAQEWDYDNGYSQSGVGSVTDYANKVTQTSSYSCNYSASVSGTQNLGHGTYYNSGDFTGQYVMDGVYVIHAGHPGRTTMWDGDGTLTCSVGTLTQTGFVNRTYVCSVPQYSCPNGGTLSGSTCVKTCTTSTLVCPGGYSDNGSNCKKDISYTFYEYKCPNAQSSQDYNYTPQNTGGDCNKTDPNTSTVNSSTLDDACNSSTPPTNNCKREKFTCVADSNRPCAKVDDKWQCSPFACNNDDLCGYATCNGLPTSNTAIMPYEYHPIEALTRSGDACIPIQCDADYEYDDGTATKVDKKVCDGEVVGGKCVEYEYVDKVGSVGIASIMNCPDGYSEYGSSTQCRKETDIGFKEYYYHTYQCPTDTNAFGETWELTEPNIERGCVDDTFGGCLNFDIETQRCQRKIHTCPNGSGTCTLDGNNKYTCSYDGCDSVRYPCIGQMCDLALNDRISFCENESCPSSQIVYEEDNKCFVDVCPEGTFEDETGLCLNEDQ